MTKVVNFQDKSVDTTKTPAVKKEGPQSPELQTFNAFFATLFNALSEKKVGYPLLFNMNLFNALMKKDKNILNAIDNLKYSKAAPHFIKLSSDEMSRIFEQAYETLCDILGPTESDSFLSSVINKVEEHETSRNFSIRNFL